MGKYKSAKALYKQLPPDHPLRQKYGDHFSRSDWRDIGRNTGVLQDALMRSEFDKQMGEVDDREALWTQFRDKVENLLDNTPEYKIPDVITQLNTKLPEIATNIRNEYVNAGNKLESITDEKLTGIMSNVTQGLEQQLQTAKTGAAEIEEGVTRLKDIYGAGATGITDYTKEGVSRIRDIAGKGMEAFQRDRGDILDTYRSATQKMLESGKRGAEAAEAGIERYEDIHGRLASRTTLPGEDIMRGQLGAQQEAAVQRIKEYGAGSPEGLTAIADVYEGGQDQLRNLAIQRAEFLTGAQKDFANALMTGGLKREETFRNLASLYGATGQIMGGAQERLSAREADEYSRLADIEGYATELGVRGVGEATRLAGRGEEVGLDVMSANLDRILGAERYKTEMGYQTGMDALSTELDVAKQASVLRAMGYEKEADALTQNAMLQAQYQDRAFDINQMMPWQAAMNYYTQGTSQYDPFGAKMQVLGDEAGWSLAQIQQQQQKQIANRQMWGNILGSVLGTAGKIGAGAFNPAASFLGNNKNMGNVSNTGNIVPDNIYPVT